MLERTVLLSDALDAEGAPEMKPSFVKGAIAMAHAYHAGPKNPAGLTLLQEYYRLEASLGNCPAILHTTSLEDVFWLALK